MPLWKQAMLRRVMAPQGNDGGDGGGGNADGGNDGAGDGDGDGGAGDGDGDDAGGAGDGDGDDAGKGDGKGKDGKDGKDGKPKKPGSKISDAEAKLLRENMQKKTALAKANTELAAARERLAEFDGLDPKELKQLVADKKAAEEAAAIAAGDFESVKKRMADEHQRDTKALKDRVAEVEGVNNALKAQIDELTVGQAFANSKFLPAETVYTPSKARKLYGEHVDLVDGEVVVFDKPRGAAGRSAIVNQYGHNMEFDQAIQRVVEADPDRDTILKSKVKPGAGSNTKPGKAPVKPDNAGKSSQDKIAAGLASLNIQLNSGKIG